MLSALHIKNFALIEQLDVEFTDGFSSITGETGAGKSIILGAIDLLRGKRADTKVLRQKDKKAVVEAEFLISDYKGVNDFLKEMDYEIHPDGLLILRRDISANGRSRGFINDSPANLQVMEQLAGLLLDVHSQHQTQAIIADPKMRLKFLDALDADSAPLDNYKKIFKEYLELRHRVRDYRIRLEKSQQNRDITLFKLEQLRKLNPKPGEQLQLEQRYKLLSNAKQIKDIIHESTSILSYNQDSVITQLEKVYSLFKKTHLGNLMPETEPSVAERIESIIIELKDLVESIDESNNTVDDPNELEKIENRLNSIYEAQLYFKLKNADELYYLKQELEKTLEEENVDASQLAETEKAMKQKGAELSEAAGVLSQRREKLAKQFSIDLQTAAQELGLPNLRFKAQITPAKLSYEGGDNVDFLCAFNKNQEFMELQNTASGGEASRLMLCMKEIIAGKTELPTLIFDEIDTGISGEIASKAGNLMRKMGKRIQVISITHLPQVAVAADTQYKVYKTDIGNETYTCIKKLSPAERRTEIAKMLSGEIIDEAALQNAQSLLEKAQK